MTWKPKTHNVIRSWGSACWGGEPRALGGLHDNDTQMTPKGCPSRLSAARPKINLFDEPSEDVKKEEVWVTVRDVCMCLPVKKSPLVFFPITYHWGSQDRSSPFFLHEDFCFRQLNQAISKRTRPDPPFVRPTVDTDWVRTNPSFWEWMERGWDWILATDFERSFTVEVTITNICTDGSHRTSCENVIWSASVVQDVWIWWSKLSQKKCRHVEIQLSTNLINKQKISRLNWPRFLHILHCPSFQSSRSSLDSANQRIWMKDSIFNWPIPCQDRAKFHDQTVYSCTFTFHGCFIYWPNKWKVNPLIQFCIAAVLHKHNLQLRNPPFPSWAVWALLSCLFAPFFSQK